MKKIVLLPLLTLLAVAVLFIAACAPGKATAGQATGGRGGGSDTVVLADVGSCSSTITGIEGDKKNGDKFTYTNDCKSNSMVNKYYCTTDKATKRNAVRKSTFSCTNTQVCQNGACVATAPPAAVCGNKVREGSEVCDGTDLGGFTCTAGLKDPGATGTLGCKSDCTAFDTSGCVASETPLEVTPVVQAQEFCDGVDNNNNGVIDDGCDADNDGFCKAGLLKKDTYYNCGALANDPSMDWKNDPNNECCPWGEGPQSPQTPPDCDDTNGAVRPNAGEVCANSIDDNCNGQIDEVACPAIVDQTGNKSNTT